MHGAFPRLPSRAQRLRTCASRCKSTCWLARAEEELIAKLAEMKHTDASAAGNGDQRLDVALRTPRSCPRDHVRCRIATLPKNSDALFVRRGYPPGCVFA